MLALLGIIPNLGNHNQLLHKHIYIPFVSFLRSDRQNQIHMNDCYSWYPLEFVNKTNYAYILVDPTIIYK